MKKLYSASITASLLLSVIAIDASAVSIQGRATGSFCCVIDANGTLIPSSGSTTYAINNNDDGSSTGNATARVAWGTAAQKPV